MSIKTVKRSIFQRFLGIPATGHPRDKGCWTYSDGKVVVDLKRTPELAMPGGAIRIEGRALPNRILLIHGEDGQYHAFLNRCRHMGRRLDPVPGNQAVQCCSVSKTTYDYNGSVLFGPAKEPARTLTVQQEDHTLLILLES